MQLDQHAQLGALGQRRPEPVQRAVGPVGVHIGLELHHLEAVFRHVAFDGLDAVLHAAARVVDEAADQPVRILAHHFQRVGHVGVDGFGAGYFAVRVGIDGVALRRLDKGLVDAARLAVHEIRAVHHLDQAFAGEWVAIVAPGQIDQVGRITAGVDDHGISSQYFRLGWRTVSYASLIWRTVRGAFAGDK